MLNVVRKAIPLKNLPDVSSKTLCKVEFGEKLELMDKVDEWYLAKYVICHGRNGTKRYEGFVRKEWVSTHTIHDVARLPYQNLTEKTFPTTMVYGSCDIAGRIEPGETVQVIAWCKPYALTSKGWARVDLIAHAENATENCLIRKKCNDDDGIAELYQAIAQQAREDYVMSEAMRTGIRVWARSDSFATIYGDCGEEFMKSCQEEAKRRRKGTENPNRFLDRNGVWRYV